MMLAKDPVNRGTWDDIKKHAWWSTPVVDKSLLKKDTGGNKHFDFDKLKH